MGKQRLKNTVNSIMINMAIPESSGSTLARPEHSNLVQENYLYAVNHVF